MASMSFSLRKAVRCFLMFVMAVLFITPRMAAAAQSDGLVDWSIEIQTTIPAQEVSAQGGEDIIKNDILNRLKGSADGSLVNLDVQATGVSDENNLYTIKAQGNTTLDQFRQVVFVDLAQDVNFLGGPMTMTITGSAAGQGQTFPVQLESNPSTGYYWSVSGIDEAVLTQEGESGFEAKTQRPLYGAPLKQTFNLRQVGSGETTINLVYGKPSEATAQSTPARHITLNVGELPASIDLTNPTPQRERLHSLDEIGPQLESGLENAGAQALPTSFDWRNVSGVDYTTAVRDQGDCGSCYAFSMVGAMESALKRAGVTADLSEQYLVSCTMASNLTDPNAGCDGGYMDTHKYHYDTKATNQTAAGAVLESVKPYTATNGTCTSNYAKPYKLTGWKYISGSWSTMPTVDQIKNAIYNYGPVSAGVCAGSKFDAYTGGIFTSNESSTCGGSTNHAIVLVGWGTDTSGNTYWILRNSWGSSWGENGYMRILSSVSTVGEEATYVTYSGTVNPTVTPTVTTTVTTVPTITTTVAPTTTTTVSPTKTPTVSPTPNPTTTQTATPTETPVVTTFDNFDFATAISLDVKGDYSLSSSTTDATQDNTYDPSFYTGSKYYNTVWFKYTPSANGTITVSTEGSDYDTLLGIWTGSKGSLRNSAWNDDALTGEQYSLISKQLSAGTTYYIEAASYDNGGGSLELAVHFDETGSSPTGTFDDTDAGISYSGTWMHANSSPSYNGTLSTTRFNGDTAVMQFNGSRAALLFSKKNGYGQLKVEIADSSAAVVASATINQAGGSTLYKEQWNSGVLSGTGPYTMTMTNMSAKTVNIDAIIIADIPESESIGIVEDITTSFNFAGYWKTADDPLDGASNTLAVSSASGDSAVLKFSGRQANIQYNRISGNGTMKAVIIDKDNTQVVSANISQSSSGRGGNKETWSSGDLGENGPFTLTLSHTYGGAVNVDRVVLKDAAAVVDVDTLQTIDDANSNMEFRGFWKALDNQKGTNAGTLAESSAIGDFARLKFIGNRAAVAYSVKKGAGSLNITIRDASQAVVSTATINQNSKNAGNQQTWFSGALGSAGQYTITLTHQSGGAVNLDALVVMDAAVDATGSLDNTELGTLDYKGLWNQVARTGAASNTLAISQKVGDSVKFNISGRQIGLIYAREWSAGSMTVTITNVSTGEAAITPIVINQKSVSKSPQLQQQWSSGDLGSSAVYTVTITHTSGGNVNLDGVSVGQSSPLRVAMGTAAGDDLKTSIDYAGFWSFASGLNGPDGGTLTRSSVRGSEARVLFNGSQITLYFAKELKGGIIEISVDGGTPVSVNQLSRKTLYGQNWTSPVLAQGDHTLTVRHIWGSQINVAGVKVN